MNVAVIYGGKSGEHEVSIISATSIVRNLSQDKYTVFLIGITKDGRWFFQNPSQLKEVCENPDILLRIEENKESAVSLVPGGGTKGGIATARGSIAIDIAFIVLHGTYGEDGTIQGLFDMLAIPYTGCGTMSSSLAMDKEKTKIVWQSNNLPVLPHVCLHKDEMTKNTAAYNALIKKAEENFGYPLFVKPCSAGSSCGATKATTSKELYKALKEGFDEEKVYQHMQKYMIDIVAKQKHLSMEKMEKVPCFYFLYSNIFLRVVRKTDLWESTQKHDKKSFDVTMKKCLWRTACVENDCAELCHLFCDVDNVTYGKLEKIGFSRTKTLGYGEDCCDFHFYKKK